MKNGIVTATCLPHLAVGQVFERFPKSFNNLNLKKSFSSAWKALNENIFIDLKNRLDSPCLYTCGFGQELQVKIRESRWRLQLGNKNQYLIA